MADLLSQALAGTSPSAATPVRDLSKKSALAEAADHASPGRITLTPAPVTNPDGSVSMPDETGKFRIPATVAGVTFKVTGFGDKRLPSYQPVAATLERLDIRHVVGLVRFALHVSGTWGVTEVHHCGISGDTVRTDCHGNGRAVDLIGVVGSSAGVPYHLTVFNDCSRPGTKGGREAHHSQRPLAGRANRVPGPLSRALTPRWRGLRVRPKDLRREGSAWERRIPRS